MNVNELRALQGLGPTGGDRAPALPQPQSPGVDFADTLEDAVNKVDDLQKAAGDQIASFAAGENDNIHEVVISMNQAELSFKLMTEVRNKMLETYHELMRMQV